MNNMEEKLWAYIDGACSPEDQLAITELIDTDALVRSKYEQLLKLNAEFSAMELDEPPMAFTYNVMEAIRNENASVPLKAAINKKIIRGIGLFFVLTLTAALIFILASVKFSGGQPVNLSQYLKTPAIDAGKARILVQAFVFFDVILGLYLFDAYLRRKKREKSA